MWKKLKWQNYKQKKLENPKFKQAYDELEEEFSALDKKFTEEQSEEKIFYARNEKFFEQTANL